MQGYRRTPAIVAIVTGVIITVGFTVLGLYAALHDTVSFLKDVSLDDAIGTTWGVVVGAAMFILVVVFVIALVARVRRQDCISFDNPDGEVIIAISAIEDFIKRLGRSFDEVRDIFPAVVAVDGGVAIEARVTLWDDQNIHAACERIQKAVRAQVQSFFGLANVHTVKVFIARTVSRGEPGPTSTPDEDYPEEPTEEPEGDRHGP
jgi:uncharacterized alkaline shock family protein YloU